MHHLNLNSVNSLFLSLAITLLPSCASEYPIPDKTARTTQENVTPIQKTKTTYVVNKTPSQPEQRIPETNLKTDENVILLPTNAIFDSNTNRWKLNIHGWVFEPEKNSIWRNGLIKSLAFFIGAKKNTPDGKRFEQRSAMFLVDNERNKTIVIKAAQQYLSSPKSKPNGHFEFTTTLAPGKEKCHNWLKLEVHTQQGDKRDFSGQVQCLSNDGISVISDIDDTIKDSNVLDKKKLLKKTFLKEFKAVTGMSEIYRQWRKKGYQFHYVSSSPWQLYPALSEFIAAQGYPPGSMHLKLIRLKDKSIFNLFASPEEGKLPTITRLLNDYPKRRFILVGDSGERDANIYASIAKDYPGRIIKIYIRDVKGDKKSVRDIFADLPPEQWTIFSDASEILSTRALLTPVK